LSSGYLARGVVAEVVFTGALESLRVRLENGVQAPLLAQPDGAAGASLLVTRTQHEQRGFEIHPGQDVAIGVRRVHVLPTPLSSFTACAASPALADALSRQPLLAELAVRMKTRIAMRAEPQLGVPEAACGGSRTDADRGRHGAHTLRRALPRTARRRAVADADRVPRFAMSFRQPSVLPGFGLTFGFTTFFLSAIVLLPLAALALAAASLHWSDFVHVVLSPRALGSYRLSFGASFLAAAINLVFGLIIAWTLVRYEFPGRGLIDALIDMPFALPTAVSGIA